MSTAPRTDARPLPAQGGVRVRLWPIGLAALAVIAVFTSTWRLDLDGPDRLLMLNRGLARLSFLFFIPIYVASPLAAWRPGGFTRELIRIRRSLGLGYALVMAAHLGAIFAQQRSAGSEPLDTLTLLGGGLGFVFIAALAATSNDGAMRRLGRRGWKRLHASALHWLWFIYAITYLGRVAERGFEYVPGLAVVLFLPLLRLSVRWRPER